MQSKRSYLTWTLLTVTAVVLCVIGLFLGWHHHLEKDPTRITLVCLAMCAVATALCGRLTWRLSNGADPEVIAEDMEDVEYASSLQVSIGLIGTTIGYFMMLAGGADTGDPAQIIRMTFTHASVAIINTAVGAVTGVFVEVQYRVLRHAVRRKRRELRRSARAAGQPPAKGGAQ